ncbi:APC family permease [Fusibacillus kribbianus]|uniref:APC family permease n=1 Tax=Fusibacillus kribbianus TaxID=3044208 RepID=A0AAP4BBU1_9FIRM|nr:APC family permease [Ruminococcus sp. YH-rum2234]MDI9241519.1 APC family permease [Ruminococcus sp. YH-rum2234]
MKQQKMRLFSCILMGIGSIIGASVFATTPISIKIIGGNGIVIGFICAAFFVFLRSIPEMLLVSALPANGGSYMYLTRLVHPILGIWDAFNELAVGVLKIATMALTFATYFCMLVPSCPEAIAAVVCILIFTVISCLGIKFSSTVQNICVAVLLVALGIYIFGGWGATVVSFGEVISTTFQLGALWAAMGIMHGSLIGANVLYYSAEDIENPGKNVPIAYLVSTLATAVVYALVAYVTVGVMPNFYEIDNLATVAGKFMGPAMFTFFVAGGALLAVVTSINSAMMMFSRINFAAARDGLFPKAISKLNKYHAPAYSLCLNSLIAVVLIVAGLNLEDVVKITTIPGLLLLPIIFFSVFMLPVKFPYAYKNSYIRTPHVLNCILTVAAGVACVWLGAYVLFQMAPRNWIMMIGFYVVVIVYTIIRRQYVMKTEGYDIVKKMKEPYEPWHEMERAAKAELEGK